MPSRLQPSVRWPQSTIVHLRLRILVFPRQNLHVRSSFLASPSVQIKYWRYHRSPSSNTRGVGGLIGPGRDPAQKGRTQWRPCPIRVDGDVSFAKAPPRPWGSINYDTILRVECCERVRWVLWLVAKKEGRSLVKLVHWLLVEEGRS